MTVTRLTRDLLAEGFTHNELARQTRSGDLLRLRRGAYAPVAADDPGGAARHLQVIEATVRLISPDAVVSHVSAAVAHGLPVFADQLDRVQLTRSDVPGGKKRPLLQLHAAPLHESEVVDVKGLRLTSLARTVVDLGRASTFDKAVVAGDAALRRGLTRGELTECLERSRGRPGMAQARRVVAFLDARSESPGESLSRVVFHQLGLPPPTPQYEVFDDQGRLVGRSDFGWEQFRTLGEFDGRIKYGRLLKPGETIEDVIYREKLREDALREEIWEMVRWTFADLSAPKALEQRLRRAFSRGSLRR